MIVGICGSPRNGATEHVLKEALSKLEAMGFETEFFTVKNKKIGYCIHCDHCLTHKECIIKDDMYTVYGLLKKADGIIFATPVYNGGVSAQIKAVMDRCRAMFAADIDVLKHKVGMAITVGGDRIGGQEHGAADIDVLKHKVGMAITVGGDRIGGQEQASMQIHTFYILSGVIPVSGGSFGANLGANFWSKDTLEGVKEDKEGFRSLKKTVKSFVESLNRIEINKKG